MWKYRRRSIHANGRADASGRSLYRSLCRTFVCACACRSSSLAEARKLAAHAQEIGANAISATLPTYFKITTEEVLIQCLQEIAGAAPELPFYYYNIPVLTGVHIDMVSFLQRGNEMIPNLAGIKYTSPLLHDFQGCLAANNSSLICCTAPMRCFCQHWL
jgi:dihydrodipicolinate synthase/N-acetylneuraminate lyase